MYLLMPLQVFLCRSASVNVSGTALLIWLNWNGLVKKKIRPNCLVNLKMSKWYNWRGEGMLWPNQFTQPHSLIRFFSPTKLVGLNSFSSIRSMLNSRSITYRFKNQTGSDLIQNTAQILSFLHLYTFRHRYLKYFGCNWVRVGVCIQTSSTQNISGMPKNEICVQDSDLCLSPVAKFIL